MSFPFSPEIMTKEILYSCPNPRIHAEFLMSTKQSSEQLTSVTFFWWYMSPALSGFIFQIDSQDFVQGLPWTMILHICVSGSWDYSLVKRLASHCWAEGAVNTAQGLFCKNRAHSVLRNGSLSTRRKQNYS
jgi:hypothetical protein